MTPPAKRIVRDLMEGRGTETVATEYDVGVDVVADLHDVVDRAIERWRAKHGENPVSEGDELTTTIRSMGQKGDGIAFVDGFTIFVESEDPQRTVQINDEVDIRVHTVKESFAFAHAKRWH